jgi:hypothetical protein
MWSSCKNKVTFFDKITKINNFKNRPEEKYGNKKKQEP